MIGKSSVATNLLNSPAMAPVIFVILKFYTVVNMGYCITPFVFLSCAKWWNLYSVVRFYGFIIFFPWVFLYKPVLYAVLKSVDSSFHRPPAKSAKAE